MGFSGVLDSSDLPDQTCNITDLEKEAQECRSSPDVPGWLTASCGHTTPAASARRGPFPRALRVEGHTMPPSMCEKFRRPMAKRVREAAKAANKPVTIHLDTKGPEIRTGFFKEGGKINLVAGQDLKLVTDYSFKGDSTCFALSYEKLCTSGKEAASYSARTAPFRSR